ncbi:TonB-dependent receptor domain protein [Novosphingobium nitrogenifigens DSM 19370]|uniref:TonB-dependent receptor domain protein n=1 Tax=Novosphingobium nitrogenifigens DSM 19370 TaxID=983920 RepID=F1Z6I6_9SPHN|nr:TonB-dependent receptor domain protein [Novosphingobium nitrogenifigens DSM 19370]
MRAAASVMALAQLVPAVAHAEDAGAAGAEAPSASTQLETITVTAQKTKTGLQKTPIAITAMSGDQLAKIDIRSAIDLDRHIPGMTVSDSGAFPVNITIRGVGYDGLQNLSAQPGVAYVENGVYIASPIAVVSSYLDVGQLEVLRGPQGTVNGQNADGGAINVTTNMPKLDAFHMGVEGSYGSYNYQRENGMVNLPLTKNLAFRATVQHEAHDGWYYAPNYPGNDHIGSQNAWTARGTFLWTPTDRLTVTVWGELYSNDINGVGARNMIDPIAGVRATSNDYATPEQTRSRIAAATAAYDLGGATAKFSTSYQYAFINNRNSADSLSTAQALEYYGVKDNIPEHSWGLNTVNEEFNVASKPGGRFDWIVGLFYQHTSGNENVFETQQGSSLIGTPYTIDYSAAGNPALYLAQQAAYGLSFASVSNAHRNSAAGYGQLTWHITDKLRLTGGLRYSWDKYTAHTAANFNIADLKSEFRKVTGKASVEYDVAPHSTLYASFSTGVKPGGANLNTSSTQIPQSFTHEFVRAYEIGSKNEFFDRKLRLNVSAFYNDYRNYQTDSEDPLPYQGGQTNIPKSKVYGLETEVSLILPQGWRIDANATAMGSRVDSHMHMLDAYSAQAINRATGGPYGTGNVDARYAAYFASDVYGNQLGRVPNFSTAMTISKSTDLPFGKLDAAVDANYRSPYWERVYNNPATDRVGSQFMMNLNLHFQPKRGPWYLELQVTNLTDSSDIATRFAENFGVGGVFDVYVPPRQVIGRVGVKF